jgi:hypothetical protein
MVFSWKTSAPNLTPAAGAIPFTTSRADAASIAANLPNPLTTSDPKAWGD